MLETDETETVLVQTPFISQIPCLLNLFKRLFKRLSKRPFHTISCNIRFYQTLLAMINIIIETKIHQIEPIKSTIYNSIQPKGLSKYTLVQYYLFTPVIQLDYFYYQREDSPILVFWSPFLWSTQPPICHKTLTQIGWIFEALGLQVSL